MSDSVSFDRAAAYYDRTRGFPEAAMRRTVELLAAELGPRGRVLEIGVGTGQVALPMREAGVDVVGLDLARPMMDRLIEKAGGRVLPLVQADATRMPFADGAFGGAYFRWVLHLVPAWEAVMTELARVVHSGGAIVASLGGYGGPRSEVHRRFGEITGLSVEPAGLGWGDWARLDAHMRAFGAGVRSLPSYTYVERDGLDDFLDGLEGNHYSWAWPIDDDLRLRATAEVRAWAEERFGPLDRVPRAEHEVVWHAYDLP